jgi:hypothetical protein
MEAGIHDIYADYGTPYTVTFEYTEDDGTAISFSGGTLSFHVKRSIIPYETYFSINSNGAVIEGAMPYPNSDSGYGTLTIESDGTANLEIFGSTMSELQPMTYFYTLVYTSGGTETMLMKGKFCVEGA